MHIQCKSDWFIDFIAESVFLDKGENDAIVLKNSFNIWMKIKL